MLFSHSAAELAAYGLLAVVLAFACNIFYNLFLHPLRSFPGPWYSRASILWTIYHAYHGDYIFAVNDLHKKYGTVVRVAPNELAFTDASAWKDIYGHRSGIPEYMKDKSQELGDTPEHPNIIIAPREAHAKTRRLLSNAFSDTRIREHEFVISGYLDMLIDRMRDTEGPLDMEKWWNFMTFDTIGHLSFAEPFGCMGSGETHPWLHLSRNTNKYVQYLRNLKRIHPKLAYLLIRFTPAEIRLEYLRNHEEAKEKLLRRRSKQLPYKDFATQMLIAEAKGQFHPEDVISNLPILIHAGSDTTSILLTSCTYFLMTHPRVYDLLVKEVRSVFKSPDDINLAHMDDAKYLMAVLNETLRIYPPAPTHHPRRLPAHGAVIAGHTIPSDAIVGINQYAISRDAHNFVRPEEFIPERYLNPTDDEWKNERKEASQPFSFGPRNCIGRRIALSEARLAFARTLYNFDLEMAPGQEDWLDTKIFTRWAQKPLKIIFRPVSRPQERPAETPAQ